MYQNLYPKVYCTIKIFHTVSWIFAIIRTVRSFGVCAVIDQMNQI